MLICFSYSGAGIGWMGQLDSNTASIPLTTAPETITTTEDERPLNELTAAATEAPSEQPLFTNILSQSTGPSPEYLQSLLNVNEALLAQSLAKTDTNDKSMNTPMLIPVQEQLNNMLMSENSPLVTPQEDDNTASGYMDSIHPNSEKIISPLSNDKRLDLPLSTATSTAAITATTTNTVNRTLFQH